MKSAANSSKVRGRTSKSNLELPSSTGNNEDRPRTTGSSSKVTGRSPELFDSRIRSNPVRHPSFSRSSNSVQFRFDVRCNPWLNRTYDPLWEIRPPSAWEFAIPIVRDVRMRDPEKEVERSTASRVPTHNEYVELPASSNPHTSISNSCIVSTSTTAEDNPTICSNRLLFFCGILSLLVLFCDG